MSFFNSKGWHETTYYTISPSVPHPDERTNTADQPPHITFKMIPSPESLEQTAAAMRTNDAGEPVEYRNLGTQDDWAITHNPSWRVEAIEYRPGPEPSIVPWDCPEDVPENCWVRNSDEPEGMSMVIAVGCDGIICGGENPYRETWDELQERPKTEYSTDRKTWHPCTKEAAK